MIATTIEQSERLVRAGVSTDSADMMWAKNVATKFPHQLIVLGESKFSNRTAGYIHIPAWSLSALWDILHRRDKTYEIATNMDSAGLIETLVRVICYRLENQ